ncbi:T-cell receptor alpha chain V region 2B4 [Sciurus carolinensis]|nr:T-cell receptor alpha chain V region 2B4 [Sciurus carolinensis]
MWLPRVLDVQVTVLGPLTGAAGQSVEQPTELTAVEGAFIQVNCTYRTSGFNGLSWYQQRDGRAPLFLSYSVLDGVERRGHFSTFLSRSDGYGYLLLRELQMKDSASYLCAVRDTVTMGPIRLQQDPNINLKGNRQA